MNAYRAAVLGAALCVTLAVLFPLAVAVAVDMAIRAWVSVPALVLASITLAAFLSHCPGTCSVLTTCGS